MDTTRYQFIISIIQKAGELLLESRKKHVEVSYKEGDTGNFITNVDIEINNFIIEKIHSTFSGENIYSEEITGDDISSGTFWTIDPIDGTSNFAHSIPHFAVVIGFVENGKATVGAVYNPVTKELFSFQKNVGVFLNGEKVAVSSTVELKEAHILLHIGRSLKNRDWGLDLQKTILASAKKNINLGSSALDLCFLVSGRVDAVIYGTMTTLDISPTIEMVRLSGGEVYDLKGKPVLFSSKPQNIIATSTPELFKEIKDVMKILPA